MKNIMTKTLKTLAVAGMTMGLVAQTAEAGDVSAYEGVTLNGRALSELSDPSGSWWFVPKSDTLQLNGQITNRFELSGASANGFNVAVAQNGKAITLHADAMNPVEAVGKSGLFCYAVPDAQHPLRDQSFNVTADGKISLTGGIWYLNPTGRYDKTELDCTVLADGIWKLTYLSAKVSRLRGN